MNKPLIPLIFFYSLLSGCADSDNINKSKKNITYFENGRISTIESDFSNGSINGYSNSYYEDGNIEFSVGKLNNKQHGASIGFYKNGSVAQFVMWDNGVLDGEEIFYYKNGRIRYRGHNLNGAKEGLWEFYDSLGILLQKKKYRNGIEK